MAPHSRSHWRSSRASNFWARDENFFCDSHADDGKQTIACRLFAFTGAYRRSNFGSDACWAAIEKACFSVDRWTQLVRLNCGTLSKDGNGRNHLKSLAKGLDDGLGRSQRSSDDLPHMRRAKKREQFFWKRAYFANFLIKIFFELPSTKPAM